ncbi:MAG: hypothetical protein ACE5GE_12550, partial [Phycisphaerae bacterium]
MRGTIYNRLGGSAILSLAFLGACTVPTGGGGTGQIVADFEFNDGQGLEFDVVAGQDSDIAVRNGSFTLQGPGGNPVTVGGGSIQLQPEAVSVTVNGSTEKAALTFQAGEPLNVTVWVAPPGGADADFCASGDQYGPFTVALDENF